MNEQGAMKKLEALLAEKITKGLDVAGENELIELLKNSEQARAYYFDYCELDTVLEMDRDLHRELAGDRMPKNVVALSAEHFPGNSLEKTSSPRANFEASERSMPRGWALAAVAGVALSLLVLLVLGTNTNKVSRQDPELAQDLAVDQQEGNNDEVAAEKSLVTRAEDGKATGEGQLVVVERKLTPVHDETAVEEAEPTKVTAEGRYQEMLLTAILPGSLKRPPTPFSNEGGDSKKVSFSRDIRPLLSDNCYHCHGPDEGSREAELRLDIEEGVFADRGSDKAVLIHRGDPAKSDLYRRLIAKDPDDLMPPGKTHKVMTAQQIAKVKQWIEQGAEWESHWAFISPKKAALPKVKGDWGRNEIDRYVLAGLEEAGLSASPEADRRTLIRRATLDATGLPPTPQEVEQFLADRSKDAYEHLVDRLLDSPRYGEHRARYWLDAARYGDTHGLHLDNYRSIWPYRDWVIKAYNDNMPFDQFTIEQLAGDLLPEPTQEQLVATGFNRCNVTTNEGGSIKEELLSRYAIDRVSTMGSVWLGLTLGCTQCHDHKFDPIKQKEFYQLMAYFNNTEQPGMDGNSFESPPSIRVYASKESKNEVDLLQKKITEQGEKLTQLNKVDLEGYEKWSKDSKQAAKDGSTLRLPSGLFKKDVKWGDQSEPIDLGEVAAFNREQPFSMRFRFVAPKEPGRAIVFSRVDPENAMRGYRLVWEDEGLTLELIERWPSRMLRKGTSRSFKVGSTSDVVITYDGSGISEGIMIYINSKAPNTRVLRNWIDTMKDDFVSNATLKIGGKQGEGYLNTGGLELQFYDRCLSVAEMSLLYNKRRVSTLLEKKTPSKAEKQSLKHIYELTKNKGYRDVFFEISKLEAKKSQLMSHAPETLIWKEKNEAAKAWVLDRGEYDKPKEEVAPAVPEVLHEMAEGAAKNRLSLASWIVDDANPLTARVTVNRFWGELFGLGLVKTAGDFGAQGMHPSHPELLDWLALRFIESGWDVKAIYKEMLMSATYRQSSRVTPELQEKGPDNIHLARGPRFRLDAEMIRDQALAAGGVLLDKIGGPAVKPYQPAGLWSAVGHTVSNTQTFSQDYGDALFRRSIYTFIKRTSPPPSMSLFNAPNRESCVVTRERTNTPLQALALMNDPQYIDAARHLALRTLEHGKTLDERIAYLFEILLARPLSGDDLAVMKQSYLDFEKNYQQNVDAAKELSAAAVQAEKNKVGPVQLASWIMLSNQMLNLDEVINKN